MRECPRCANCYPETPEYWHRNRRRPGGIDFYCKECRRERWRNMSQEEKDRRKEYFCDVWYPSHRDLVMDRVRAGRKRLREARKAPACDGSDQVAGAHRPA